MHEYRRIEEPPPIPRSTHPIRPAPGAGIFTTWRRRVAEKRADTGPGRSWKPANAPAVVLGVVALALIGAQAWSLHRLSRVRADLSVAEGRLEEARAGVRLLWDTAKRLDQDQIARSDELTDSIHSVFSYAQGEVRLWEAAYYALEQRLDENAGRIGRNGEAIAKMTAGARAVNARLDDLARGDQAQRVRLEELARGGEAQGTRLDALERQSRSHGSIVEALARRTETQEATVAGVTTTVATLRRALAELDAELAGMDDRVAASGSVVGEMDTRVDQLDVWADGFRRAGLSGETVDRRLSVLADELRRVRARVDSLRSAAAVRVAAQPRQ